MMNLNAPLTALKKDMGGLIIRRFPCMEEIMAVFPHGMTWTVLSSSKEGIR